MNARYLKSTVLCLLLVGGLAAASKEAPPADRPGSEPSPGEFESFKLITERNIFDTTRRAGHKAAEDAPKPKSAETITLVGTMSYAKGPYAFFDGSSSEFSKVVTVGQSIGGLKLTAVNRNSIKLESGTNVLELAVGMRLRREEDAPWQVSGTPTPSLSESSSSSSESSSSGGQSEILKRLMKQREQELK